MLLWNCWAFLVFFRLDYTRETGWPFRDFCLDKKNGNKDYTISFQMKPDRKVNLFNLSTNFWMITCGWCRWYRLSDESDYRKSIFIHLQSSQQNETKTNKTALKYTTKKQKTPTFWWSHVDDADDTDDPDRSVTDTDRQTNIVGFWSPSTQKALKGKYYGIYLKLNT